ncbi:MAG: hypothetical protein ACOCRK_03605 [bacterium]
MKTIVPVENNTIHKIKFIKNKNQGNADWGADIVVYHKKKNVISLIQCKCTTKKSFDSANSKRILDVAKYIKKNNPNIKIKEIILMTTLDTVNSKEWKKHRVIGLKEITMAKISKKLTQKDQKLLDKITLKTDIPKYLKYLEKKYNSYKRKMKYHKTRYDSAEKKIKANAQKKAKLSSKKGNDEQIKKLNEADKKLRQNKVKYKINYDKNKAHYEYILKKYKEIKSKAK